MTATEEWVQTLSALEAAAREARRFSDPDSTPDRVLVELHWRAAVVLSLLEANLAPREAVVGQARGPIFTTLPEGEFPFTVEIVDEATCEVVERHEVSGPGVLNVKSYAPRKVSVVTTFPTVRVTTDSHGNTTEEEL